MRFLSIILVALALSGCTVPVKRAFPEVPPDLLEKCPDLLLVPNGTTKLSEVMPVIVENYGNYKECQLKVDAWRAWYSRQQKEFNKVDSWF